MKTRTSKLVRFPSLLCLAVWAMGPRAVAQTPTELDLQLYGGLTIPGAVGAVYQIQYVTDFAQTNNASAWYGDDPGYTNLSDYAWYKDNSAGPTHPVGQKLANPWGLYDMHGNVWQWCQDWFDTYPGGIALDPQGPATGSFRVFRGGYWMLSARYCRSAYRFRFGPAAVYLVIGFRVVLAPGRP